MNRLTDGLIKDFKRLQSQISSAAVAVKAARDTYDSLEPYQHLVKTFSTNARTLASLLQIPDIEMEMIPIDIGMEPFKAKSELQLLKIWIDSLEISLIESDKQAQIQQTEFLIPSGKSLTANNLISQILQSAKMSVKIVDNYLSEDSAIMIESATNSNVIVNIITTDNVEPKFKSFLDKVEIIKKGWQASFEVKLSKAFHDRYIIIDDNDVWLSGPSIDSLGIKKPGVVCKLTDIGSDVIQKFNDAWIAASNP
ncbi:hypothetical protein KBC80_04250 [Candidatus Woesebacteria bacterium]|nr:hypothetical protein [Candidatus Woesebacteria bacterium]